MTNVKDNNPFDSLKATLTSDARDWALVKRDAWIYGIVVGWGSALREVANSHRLEQAEIDRLDALRWKFEWARHVYVVDEKRASGGSGGPQASAIEAKRNFYAGIISALAVIELHHQDTIHEEIVALCDLDELLAHARAEDEVEFSGLARYEKSNTTGRAR